MNLADFNTLEEAQAYSETRGVMIHRNTMNSLLAEHGRYKRLKAIANDANHHMCDAVDAFLDSTEYNLMQSDATGQKILAMFDALIASENNDIELIACRDKALAIANKPHYPFANATKHDFDKAKGNMVYAQVTPVNGWIKITTTADCEPHRPQIYADIQGVKRRVAGFDMVSTASDYLAQVPREYVNLWVDNAYGVI